MKNLKIPLFFKFALLLIILSIGPLIFVGLYTVNSTQDELQGTILELHTQLVESSSEKIRSYLREIANEIPYITNILSTENISWMDREAMLKTILDSHENIISISLLGEKGKEKFKVYNPTLEKEPKLLDFKDDQTFISMLKQDQKESISELYYQDAIPCLNLFYRLAITKQKVVIFINVSLKYIFDDITKLTIGKTGHAFLVDRAGKIIAHKEKKFMLKSAKDMKIVQQALKAVSIGSSEYVDRENRQVVGAYAPIKELGWAVIVQQPREEAYYSSEIVRTQARNLIAGVVILATILAFLITRSLTKPVLMLVKAAGEIAKRNFSVRINARTYDELDDLIFTFNNMSAELKKYDDMQIDRLIAEKTKTEAIIFSIADGIVMTDYKGEILLVNSQARNIFNIQSKELEGKYLWDFLPKEELKDTLNEIIREPGSKMEEIDLSSLDHAKFYQVSTRPVVTLKNEKLGVVTVLRDITLEKEIDRIKDDFLHSITHDLRNPMTSIRGFLKFLIDGIGGPLNQQQKKMVETMDRASSRLLGMINDILDLAKLESGRMELHLSETNFVEITDGIVEQLQPQITRKNIKVEVVPTNKIDIIQADSNLIERVISNLIGNALKFTPEEGTITITMEDKPDRIQLGVEDTGEGIPPDYLDKIFDKFGQVAGQRKGGTGLGLTICKYVVEAHKGNVWVESEVGHGAKFSFYIPKGLNISATGEVTCATQQEQLSEV